MKWIWCSLAIFVVCTAGGAPAQAATDPCNVDKPQGALNACYAGEALKADAALNATYRALMQKIRNDGRAVGMLKGVEHAWIDYRAKECKLEALPTEGGSAQPMVYWSCYANITHMRTKKLHDQLMCPEGDLTCLR